jgi:hypothetical protein
MLTVQLHSLYKVIITKESGKCIVNMFNELISVLYKMPVYPPPPHTHTSLSTPHVRVDCQNLVRETDTVYVFYSYRFIVQ